MYCPKCAAPIDGVKFCRQCGANVSLVPQALTGQLHPATESSLPVTPPQPDIESRSMSHAFNQVLFGLGFLVVAALVMRNASWGWVFIFPAMGAFGKAVSEYYRAAETRQQVRRPHHTAPSLPAHSANSVPPIQVPTTSELKLPAAAQDLAQPVSITEHTTALLEPSRQKAADKP